jgi:hypothetical protein
MRRLGLRDWARSAGLESLPWPLESGAHAFTVRDASGRTATTTVTVR